MSSILQSWQVSPPGASTSYEKVRSSNLAGEEGQRSGEWTFWIDSTTKLPVKAEIKEGTDARQVSYYSYDSAAQEAGALPPDFFLQQPPEPASEGCMASGQLGAWSFNKVGLTNPDPSFNAMVMGDHGPVILHPEGEAADGYEPRSELTSGGVTLSSASVDDDALTWDVTESPSQLLEVSGENVVIETEGGSPSAVITSSTPHAMEVVNGAPEHGSPESTKSGDKIVLEGTGKAYASVQPIKNEPSSINSGNRLCLTQSAIDNAAKVHKEAMEAQAAELGPRPSGTNQTTSVVVWINPHPALSGVTVTDKYGACAAPHNKTFGSDGRVDFGSCPVNKDVTLTVPSSVSAGGITYTLSDSSRTFKPPASGHTVEFNYAGQAPPPPPVEKEPWFNPLPIQINEEVGEAGASTEKPITVPPGIGCVGVASKPFRSDTALAGLIVAEASFSIRCRADAYIDAWSANLKLSRYETPKFEWVERKSKHVGGPGPATTNQGPYPIMTPCRTLDELLTEPTKQWVHEATAFVVEERPPGVVMSNAYKSKVAKLHCG